MAPNDTNNCRSKTYEFGMPGCCGRGIFDESVHWTVKRGRILHPVFALLATVAR
jgi:hypothetical protein